MKLRIAGGVAVVLAIAGIALAQRGGFGGGGGRFRSGPPEYSGPPIPVRAAEFHFIRMEYRDLQRRGYGFVSRGGMSQGWWSQDWPDAENHFTTGLQRLTRIDIGDPRHLPLTDEHIFDYPWMYSTQVGYWDLSDKEIAQLREYLLRGGFLMVDDMWGAPEWEAFRRSMARVFPDKPITDIALTDPVMHVLYDIGPNDLTFIPGSRHLRVTGPSSAQIVQPAGTAPAWRTVNDDKNRMAVAVNFDTDIGDAWEFADVPYYPEKMTALAYRYGINYIIYSMTH